MHQEEWNPNPGSQPVASGYNRFSFLISGDNREELLQGISIRLKTLDIVGCDARASFSRIDLNTESWVSSSEVSSSKWPVMIIRSSGVGFSDPYDIWMLHDHLFWKRCLKAYRYQVCSRILWWGADLHRRRNRHRQNLFSFVYCFSVIRCLLYS